jgi:serine protease Do
MRRTFTLLLITTLAAAGCRRHARSEHTPVEAAPPVPAFEAPRAERSEGHAVTPREGFADVVDRVAPTVVNISSTRVIHPGAQEAPFFSDPLLRDFFGGRGPRLPRELKQQALGSGVIVSSDGHVLTNAHVVQGASEVRVALHDKRELVARIIGVDPKTDIALLQIPAADLPFARWGDSSKVRVGEPVLAFGDPLGLGETVTSGIISAKGRGNVGIVDYEDFIQTDAAINPGNSGGPLVSADGELIGINTAIATSGGGRGNQGLGFAVPSNLARDVIKQLVEHGRVIRGWLGVAVQDVSPAMAAALGLKGVGGALIGDVDAGSPAAKAGLQRGDVIVELDGKPIGDSRALRLLTSEAAPGTRVQLTLMRRDQRTGVSVVLGEMPAAEEKPGPGEKPGAGGTLGAQVAPLTADVMKQLDLPENTAGVVVLGLQPGGRAAEAGLRPGDVIQEIDRAPVKSPKDVDQAFGKNDKRAHVLLVLREGRTHYVAIPEEAR